MESTYVDGVTPTGRLLSGAIFTPTDKGFQGKKLDNPIYYAQLAIPKSSPDLQTLFDNLTAAAHTGFTNGEHARPDFAWKYKDGDAPENVQKPGNSGCYVFTFRSQFPPRSIVDSNFQQILEPHRIKNGYQVRVSYSVKANGNHEKPGVFLNLGMLQLVTEDAEIITGPVATEVFSSPAAALPQAAGYAQPAAAQGTGEIYRPTAFQGQPNPNYSGGPVNVPPGHPNEERFLPPQPLPVQGRPPAQAAVALPAAQAAPGYSPAPAAQAAVALPAAQAAVALPAAQAAVALPAAQAAPGYAPDPSFLMPPGANQ